jgi:hypothetical protein
MFFLQLQGYRRDAVLNVRGVSKFVLKLRTGSDKVGAGGLHSIGAVRVFPLFAQMRIEGVAVVLNVKHDLILTGLQEKGIKPMQQQGAQCQANQHGEKNVEKGFEVHTFTAL